MRKVRPFAVFILIACLAAGAASARQDDPRLNALFAELKSATSQIEARATEQLIWNIWLDPGNPKIEALMERGIAAMAEDDYETALAAFNRVVALDPDYAEGFNKRATVEFLMEDFTASVADIERTLALEPRHFGAMSGLGQIYLILGNKAAALKAFEAALKIDPRLGSVAETVRNLKKDLDGKPT